MVEAVRRNPVVFQWGSQLRRCRSCGAAVNWWVNGRIGKVHTVRGVFARSPAIGPQPEMPVPKGFDYDAGGPGSRRPLYREAVPLQLPVDLGLLRRPGHRPGDHYCDLGHGGSALSSGPIQVEGKGSFRREGCSTSRLPITSNGPTPMA